MRNLKILLVTLVTLSRPVLAVFSAWHMLDGHWSMAWGLFMAAVATDLLDGQLARGWDVVTARGAFIDYCADSIVFWIMVPAAHYYSQEHSAFAKEYLNVPNVLFAGVLLTFFAVSLSVATWSEVRLWRWWMAKGNFWIGVVPVTCVGFFMAYQVGWWAVALSLGYLAFSCWLKWEFLRKMI